ncbi:MAG: site-specific integrase [Ruminococcus sp.]|nr:site-specific integrase [Ruminococcus sp.]MDE7105445.1 site-specific integrase [Ruminococcus sp.]
MNNINVYHRKDGRWESRMSIGKDNNGKKKFRSFYGKTREEAISKLTIAQQIVQEEYAVTEMTVRELFGEWLHVMSSRLKESTVANYRMKAEKHLIPTFGDIQCNLLKTREVYCFIEHKIKNGLSARYISDIIVLFKSLYRYANHEYHIKNVLDGLVMPKKKKSEIAILSKEQQVKLEQYIAKNKSLTTLGVSISMYMGLRIGELCALQWSDINLEKRTLTVRKTIQRVQCCNGKKKTKLIITEPKSEKSKREIPIPDCIMPILLKFKDKSSKYVLSGTSNPIEPRKMQYHFVKILKNANLPSVHYHSLRHLFATNCIALGFDIKTLSEILGHSSVEITLGRYVHSSMERKRACMQLLSQST